MSKKNVLIGAGLVAALLGTALYAQNGSAPATQPQTSVLADQARIQECLGETFRLITLPEDIILEEEGRTFRVYEGQSVTTKVTANKDLYDANNPNRQSDQINLFINFQDSAANPAIEIYQARQLSFNANGVIPYKPNDEAHPLYAHRNEIETGRNFTPTAREAEIEQWVSDSITAMDNKFRSCMGFVDTSKEISSPTFPEL